MPRKTARAVGKHRANRARRNCGDNHAFDDYLPLGAGIRQMTCTACGYVELDLTKLTVSEPTKVPSRKPLWE